MEGERKKQSLCNDENDDESWNRSWSRWEAMSRDVLLMIFGRLKSDEMARVVPFVCKSWREAAASSDNWSVIDIEQWCRRCDSSDVIDTTVRKLVRRSKDSVCFLSAYKITDFSFSAIAGANKGQLKVLKIPVSNVTDKMVEKHAQSLSSVTFLDISNCLNISWKGIEILGKHCKSLLQLRRNMPPLLTEAGLVPVENEALAVANTMPGLLHLELGYAIFSDRGLDAILTKCKALRHLDIRGCKNVKLEGDLEDKCEKIEEFISPWDDEWPYADSSDDDVNGGNDAASSDSD